MNEKIPVKSDDIKSDYDCGNKWTISMILAAFGIISTSDW